MCSCIQQAGFKLSPKKCQTALQEAAFLRPHVLPEGLRDLCSFLGLTSYYQNFMKKFSAITTPLNSLLEKAIPWK